MVEDTNPSQDMVDITGHLVFESVSFDKDVMEIKLPNTVVSSDYGGNFVKDVCIDKGVIPHRKISEEKILDEKSYPNFDCLMIDANSDLRYGRKDDSRKSVYELKPETVILPVGFAPDGNNEKQYSSGKEYDPEDRSTAAYFAGDLSEKKISLEELLRLESAEESKRTGTISSESSGNHMPPLHGEAVGQVSINDCHGVEAVASKTSGLVNSSVSSKDSASGCLAATEERDAASALDVEKTDSFSDIVSGSKGFNEVETAEPRFDALNSSSSDVQSSEKNHDHSESLARKAITDAVDETAVATSSSPNNVDPSDANGENNKKRENDSIGDVRDFNRRDEENCVDTMNDDTVSKSSTHAQKDSVVEQTVPEADSAKVTARIGNGYPFEPSLFGPSIMSGPASNSGHIAYSGNISLRSDSSTTSTRSFAFPVLQKEWISSPVRMAKAERRRISRRRGWRKGLICCKF